MVNLELSRQESQLLRSQIQTLIDLDVPIDVLTKAESLVNRTKNSLGIIGEGLLLFGKRPRVQRLHYVEWEERVRTRNIFGQPGRVEFGDGGNTIRCHLCGGYFTQINNTHLQAHGLGSADDYRALLGLNNDQSLASPNYGKKRGQISLDSNSGQYIQGKGHIFTVGPDPAREKKRSLQTRLEISDRYASARETGQLRSHRSGDDPNIRHLGGGNFVVFGESYYFDKNATQVIIISIDDDNIVVKGIVKGQEVTKTYKRKK